MANTRGGNVIIVDTSAAFVDATRIKAVRYEPGTGTPSVTLKKASSGGNTIYFADGSTDLFEEVDVVSMGGVYVSLAGTGTKAYLYLK